jgi:predicted NAD-dependent protein-ADP-ribosyltransferase YbiA (DUF1768 family)
MRRIELEMNFVRVISWVVVIFVVSGCGSQEAAKPQAVAPAVMSDSNRSANVVERDSRYPARWFAAVSKDGAPGWEILPQAAGPGEVILSKRQPDLGLLSNFAATPLEFHGKRYASLEGFWQAMLYPETADDPRAKFPGLTWKHTRDEVAQMTAFEAKAAGDLAEKNMEKMNIDWVSFEGRQFPYKPAEPGEQYELIVAATKEKVKQNPEVQAALVSTGDLVLKPDHHQEPNAPAAWRYFDILTAIRAELLKEPSK